MSSHVGEGERKCWPVAEVYKINGLECTDEELAWMINHWGWQGTAEEFGVTEKAIRWRARKRGIQRRSA